MLEQLSLSVVPFISSFQCSSAGDFLSTHALGLTIDDRRRTLQLPRALITVAKSSWKRIQLQQEHTDLRRSVMAKATHVGCKISCCAFAKQSAEVCDVLATITRSPLTIGGELPTFLRLPFFQTMTDITNRSSMNTQTRIRGQRPPMSAENLAAASPLTSWQEKSQLPANPRFGKN